VGWGLKFVVMREGGGSDVESKGQIHIAHNEDGISAEI